MDEMVETVDVVAYEIPFDEIEVIDETVEIYI